MARMTPADYAAMVRDGSAQSAIIECRDASGALIAALLIDWLDDGASAVYSFYDPAHEARSLGTFVIAALTRLVQARGLAHVYLGYWIGNCSKMAYKMRFKPMEILGPQGWEAFTPPLGEDAAADAEPREVKSPEPVSA
jgi:arginine-tRNA-protein transferase